MTMARLRANGGPPSQPIQSAASHATPSPAVIGPTDPSGRIAKASAPAASSARPAAMSATNTVADADA